MGGLTGRAPGAAGRSRTVERVVERLVDPALAHLVELVAWTTDGRVEVASAVGHARWEGDGARVLAGADPLPDTAPDGRTTHSHPYAWQRLHALLQPASPVVAARLPDVVVVHTGAHWWPERGGHRGEHGSLNAPQSRAPFLVSDGGTPHGGSHGVSHGVVPGMTRLAAVSDVLLADPSRRVVGLLWDGVPNDALLAGAADGSLPNVRRLLDRGHALADGAVAELPSVTLVNHATALTGVAPGVHGLVHNEFFDRATGRRVVANHEAAWHRACDLLAPGVRTVFERHPGVTACVNEPVDRGATYSTFGLLRAAGRSAGQVLGAEGSVPDAHATAELVRGDPDYARSSAIDALGLQQVLGVWEQPEPPMLTWWNTTLTDTGHHAGGPGCVEALAALADTDRRLGAWLALAERRGLLDDTMVLLTADHGSEAADPACRGDWAAALAGLPVRDEAYGFLYVD